MQAFLLPNLSLPDKPAPISHPLTQQSYSLATAILASSYFRLLCLDFTDSDADPCQVGQAVREREAGMEVTPSRGLGVEKWQPWKREPVAALCRNARRSLEHGEVSQANQTNEYRNEAPRSCLSRESRSRINKPATCHSLTQPEAFDIKKQAKRHPARHSSVAQWQSIRLLTEGL